MEPRGVETSHADDVLVVTARGPRWWKNRSVNFEELANQHKDAVYRHMLRVCGNREDAEDVLIEALLKAYRHLEQLREVAAFQAWLAQIARRACWQLKEREALQPLIQLSMLEEEGTEISDGKRSLESEVAGRQLKKLLDDAVAKLPEGDRDVFLLRDVEEMPGDEVAKRLGISVAAMKSRLHRARAMLRKQLDEVLGTE